MGNIQGLAVLNAYQKCGYGKRLMESAEKWTKDLVIDLISLNSGMNIKEAHNFYRAI